MKMDARERFQLWKQTKLNKKLEDVLEFSEEFFPLIDQEVSALPLARPLDASDPDEDLDLTVCLRVRPLLHHEEEAGFFQSVFVQNPHVLALESSFDFRNAARIVGTEVEVDVAFGSDVDNGVVYEHVGSPLVKLASQGGVGCVFVYGQRGSGKTHSAEGVLEGLAGELFKENLNVRLYASFVEIAGNAAVDLLNDKVNVDIVEDKLGVVSAVGGVEIEIKSSSHLTQLEDKATGHRQLLDPLDENLSSGTHCICKIRFENLEFSNAKNGAIYVVDMASVDGSSDPQAREAVQTNLSLTALKDCIKNRLTDEINPQVQYQVTYQQSKLTLFLKEAFDLSMKKTCKIFLVGCVSPSIADIATTLHTIKNYIMPLKAVRMKEKLEDPESENPVHWPNEEMKDWILENSGANVCVLCPWESGRDLLRVPEVEFIRRVVDGNTGLGESQAIDLYNRLWMTAIQAKKSQWKAARTVMEKTVREEDKDKDIITKIIEIGDMSLDEEPPRNTAGETVLVFNNEENMERYEKKNKTMLKNEQKRKIQAHERSEAKMFTVLDVSFDMEPIGELVKIPPYKKPERMLIENGEKNEDEFPMFDTFGDPTVPKFNHQHPRLRRKSENISSGDRSSELSQSRRNSVATISHLDNMMNTKRRNSVINLKQPKNNQMGSSRRNSVANLNSPPAILPAEKKKRRNSIIDARQPNNNPSLNGRHNVVEANHSNNNPALNRRNSITNVITISKDGRSENTIRCTPRNTQIPQLSNISQRNTLANNTPGNGELLNSTTNPSAPKKMLFNGNRNLMNETKKNRRNSVANITQTNPGSKPSKATSLSSSSRKKMQGNNTSENLRTPSSRPVVSRRNSVASMASDVTNATYTVDKFRNKFYFPL